MQSDPAPAALSVGVFLLLRDLIESRLGVWFDENKRPLLEAKLTDRLQELRLRSFLDYYYLLKYGPGSETEWPRLTDALSVQETYFWREFDQIRALVEVLVPEHVGAKRGPIHIWSAACATGEEPLTIAMALSEAGWFDRADITISASDISPAAIEKARAGIFRERSFRALPEALRSKYFTPAPGGWQVARFLQDRIHYSRANLLDPSSTAPLSLAQFVFCRNVFIYFSLPTIEQVVLHFASRMASPGFLFVGASESLLRLKTKFELEEIGRAFVYTRR
jgi:chemotaxis protein methyltransferase CheR